MRSSYCMIIHSKDTVALALCDLCILQSKPYSPDTLHQQTRDYCKEALQTMPENIYYHYATANAMVRLGEAKDALSFIGDAIQMFPKDHFAKALQRNSSYSRR